MKSKSGKKSIPPPWLMFNYLTIYINIEIIYIRNKLLNNNSLKFKKPWHIIVFYSMCPGKFYNSINIICLFVLNKSNVIDFITFFLFIYIEIRTITLQNAISNLMDFNYFSIT